MSMLAAVAARPVDPRPPVDPRRRVDPRRPVDPRRLVEPRLLVEAPLAERLVVKRWQVVPQVAERPRLVDPQLAERPRLVEPQVGRLQVAAKQRLVEKLARRARWGVRAAPSTARLRGCSGCSHFNWRVAVAPNDRGESEARAPGAVC